MTTLSSFGMFQRTVKSLELCDPDTVVDLEWVEVRTQEG